VTGMKRMSANIIELGPHTNFSSNIECITELYFQALEHVSELSEATLLPGSCG
jgi:hypothetical protein